MVLRPQTRGPQPAVRSPVPSPRSPESHDYSGATDSAHAVRQLRWTVSSRCRAITYGRRLAENGVPTPVGCWRKGVHIMADEQVIRSFRDLHAWQAAMELVLVSYGLAKRLPPTERFELSAQVRRSAVSVPSNIAEGQSYGAGGRYLHHVRIAQGSLGELETELEIAKRLGFISPGEYGEAEDLCRRTGQLLHGLARSVKRRRLQRLGHGTALVILAVMPPAILYCLR